MKDFEVLKPLNAPDINYKQLAISVSYSLGGMNYFSGQQSARGIYAYFTPCSSGANGLRSSTLMGSQRESGFKVLLEEMARKKPARVKFWAERVAGMADKIAELYEIGDNGAIMDLVKGKSEALATPYVLHVDGRTEKLPDTELETLQKAVGGYILMPKPRACSLMGSPIRLLATWLLPARSRLNKLTIASVCKLLG